VKSYADYRYYIILLLITITVILYLFW